MEREKSRGVNLKAEKDLLLSSEQRLSHEVDALVKERHNQNTLLTNLQVQLASDSIFRCFTCATDNSKQHEASGGRDADPIAESN